MGCSEDTMKYKEYFFLPALSNPALHTGFPFCVLLKENLEVFLAVCSLAASVEHLAISRLC